MAAIHLAREGPPGRVVALRRIELGLAGPSFPCVSVERKIAPIQSNAIVHILFPYPSMKMYSMAQPPPVVVFDISDDAPVAPMLNKP